MSSCVARRTTRCGESAGGRRFASSCGIAAHDGADGRAAVGLHDHAVAGLRRGLRRELVEQEGLRPADGRQLHGDERQADWRAHSCSTSQSATILTPALRSSATSARSTAANARTPRSPRYVSVSRSSAGRTSGLASVPSVGARRQHLDIPQQRRHGAQVRRQAVRDRCAAAAGLRQQILRAFEPPRRVVARGRVREHPLGDVARLDELPRARLERLAEAAVGRGGDRARFALAVSARDQRGRDVVGRQRTEAQLRTAREHRRQQRVGPRGHEDEDRRRRRLFERLQQRVLRRRDERVRLVDDHDAPRALRTAGTRARSTMSRT